MTDCLNLDYPFQRACVQPPSPLMKNRRRGVCGAGGDCTQASQSVSSSSVKTAKDKILVSGVFNDSEGLYGTTFCRCLVRRPHYSARLLRFGPRGLGEFPPKGLDDRDCVVRRCTGTRHGNVYSSIREKKGNCSLSATCFSNSVISACCFTIVSRARPPESRKY